MKGIATQAKGGAEAPPFVPLQQANGWSQALADNDPPVVTISFSPFGALRLAEMATPLFCLTFNVGSQPREVYVPASAWAPVS